MVNVPNIKLNSGYDMPQVGFGLWKVDNAVAADCVYNAIKAGYRLFDGACDYGNEVEVGQGIARAIKDGLVKREELFVVSKLWNSFHDGDKVEPIARKQLADLGLEYFDLYLIHFSAALEYVDPSVRYPPGWQVDGDKEIRRSKASLQETWTAMESLVEKGVARSIGVCNFQAQLLYDMLSYAKIPPATLQVEHHPYLTQEPLMRLAKNEGIAVTAYSSLGPASFDEFNWQHSKALQPRLKHDLISSIASKYGKNPAQVLLRWSTQRGIAVIPKTTNQDRLIENLDVTSFDLTEEEINQISALNINTRFNQPTNYFSTEKLWLFG